VVRKERRRVRSDIMVNTLTKTSASVDKRPNGQYRVQWIRHTKYPDGRVVDSFMGKRLFNTRKDADDFASGKRTNYK